MNAVTSQPAIVFHSGRRRYLTLKAACRDAARRKVFARLHENGDEISGNEDWWKPRVERLARFYAWQARNG